MVLAEDPRYEFEVDIDCTPRAKASAVTCGLKLDTRQTCFSFNKGVGACAFLESVRFVPSSTTSTSNFLRPSFYPLLPPSANATIEISLRAQRLLCDNDIDIYRLL